MLLVTSTPSIKIQVIGNIAYRNWMTLSDVDRANVAAVRDTQEVHMHIYNLFIYFGVICDSFILNTAAVY